MSQTEPRKGSVKVMIRSIVHMTEACERIWFPAALHRDKVGFEALRPRCNGCLNRLALVTTV